MKIKCDGVNYRKGFIELSENIHKNYVNLEVWGVHPDYDIPQGESSFNEMPEDSIIGNVELELSIENAKVLIRDLRNFVNRSEQSS